MLKNSDGPQVREMWKPWGSLGSILLRNPGPLIFVLLCRSLKAERGCTALTNFSLQEAVFLGEDGGVSKIVTVKVGKGKAACNRQMKN